MEFTSLFFLYGVLPLIMLGFFLIPDVGRKNAFLIAVSLFLYAMCQPAYVLLLILLCRVNFNLAKKIRRGQRGTVVLPVMLNLTVLFVLNYLDPFLVLLGVGTTSGGVLAGLASKIVEMLNGIGLSLASPTSVAALGLPFFALTAISYLLDIYRGKHPPERRFSAFLLHMVMFPKLFQGPIVRYEDTAPLLKERRNSYKNVFEGTVRFCTGLGKKVLLADYCGRMIGEFTKAGSDQTLAGSWFIAVLFLFRIYYDFSGCCDMAVGLGRIFGFRFPENFNQPYTALSVTEFCQRWNLTLGGFFRDYVYDPLCARHEGKLNQYLALTITCVLACLWHGAGFGMLILGVYIALVIILEELFEDFLTDLPYWLRRVLTVLAVLGGWILFMHPDPESLTNALKAMIGNGGVGVPGDGQRVWDSVRLIVACWIGVTSLPRKIRVYIRNTCTITGKKAKEAPNVLLRYAYLLILFAYAAAILWWCTVSRTGNAVQPSIFMNL